MPITYSMLIQFLTKYYKKGLTQKSIADLLRIDPAIISKVVNGKEQLSSVCNKDLFFENIFVEKLPNSSKNTKQVYITYDFINLLYEFLKKYGALTSALEKEYAEIKKQQSCIGISEYELGRHFILSVLQIAEESREQKIPGTKLQELFFPSHTTNITIDDTVTFATFDNPVIDNFIGRNELIKETHDKLSKDHIAVICGIGGLGKSQSALQYAYIYSNNGVYSQSQRVFFDSDLKRTLLKIPFNNLKEYQETDENKVNLRLAALEKFQSDSLLIIDNMDAQLDSESEKILLRLKKMKLHILITSRETNILGGKFNIEISPLKPDEQLTLFIRHYNRTNTPSDEELNNASANKELNLLFKEIDGHTMLIELIAKTMASNVMTPTDMLKSLSQRDDNSVSEISIEKDDNQKQEKLYTYVSYLFDTSNISEEAKKLLVYLSLSSIGGIRLRIFKNYLLKLSNMDLLNKLIYQSWAIRDKDKINPSPINDRIHLHPVIRTAVLTTEKPSLSDCQRYIQSVIDICTSAPQEVTEQDYQDLYDILINAGKNFINEYDENTIKLLKNQADILFAAHKYESALEQYNKIIQICTNSKTENLQKKLPSIYDICADIYVKIADYNKAIANYKKAINLWEDMPNKDYCKLIDCYNHLANVYRKDSKYTAALDSFRQAENRMDVNNIKNPELEADIKNNIGIVYINLDKLDDALEYYEKAKVIRETQSIPNLKQIAYSYHNIGTVFQRQKKIDKAIEYHTKGLELRYQVYKGKKDSVLADSLTMLGNDYAAIVEENDGTNIENYKKAMDFMKQGLQIRTDILGPNHPATAWSYESMGRLDFSQKNYKNALNSFKSCLNIRINSLGEQHAYTAEAYQWLGETYFKLNELNQAKINLQKAYDIQGMVKKSAQQETKKYLDMVNKKIIDK